MFRNRVWICGSRRIDKGSKNEPQGDCEQNMTKAEVGFDEVNTATSRFLSIQLFDKLEFV